jgi:hypothetical protein
LCAAAPVPASSGRTDRHRLNRAGDRQANRALHTIVVVRMRHDQRTRDYVARRTLEGLMTSAWRNAAPVTAAQPGPASAPLCAIPGEAGTPAAARLIPIMREAKLSK